jgi:hypothetical protein
MALDLVWMWDGLTHNPIANDLIDIMSAYAAFSPAQWLLPARPEPKEMPKVWDLNATQGWYDFTLRSTRDPKWIRRLAGRHETGAHGVSDPLAGGAAVMSWA